MHCGGSDMLFLRQFSKTEMFVLNSQHWHRRTHVYSICTAKNKVDVAIDGLLLHCLSNDPLMKLNEVTCNIGPIINSSLSYCAAINLIPRDTPKGKCFILLL